MPSPLPWRPHNPSDWLRSTTVRQMSLAAQMIYMYLLDIQWEDGHIEDDEAEVMAILRVSADEWGQFVKFFDRCFPVCDDGKRRNPRLQRDREEAHERNRVNKERAAKGGAAKNRPKHERNPSTPQDCLGSASSTRQALVKHSSSTPQDCLGSASSTRQALVKHSSSTPQDCLGSASGVLESAYSQSHIQSQIHISPYLALQDSPPLGEGGPLEDAGEPVEPCEEPPWWVGRSDGPALLAARLANIRRGAKCVFGPDALPREAVEKVWQRLSGICPDDEEEEHLLDAFERYCANPKKPLYTSPTRALGQWMSKQEASWLRLKRERSYAKSTRMPGKGPLGPDGCTDGGSDCGAAFLANFDGCGDGGEAFVRALDAKPPGGAGGG